MRLATTLSCVCFIFGLAPAARPGDVVLPDGFVVETVPVGGSVVAELADGSLLRSVGTFGFEVLIRQYPDGSVIPYAEGFGSLAGAVQAADGSVLVGDSFDATPLWLLVDGNADGDCLDAGETVAHPAAAAISALGVAPYDIALRDGEPGHCYIVGTAPADVVVLRTEVAGPSALPYADGMRIAGGLAWRDDVLYVIDFDFGNVTIVWAFADGNGDDDALDAGERSVYADNLVGGYDLLGLDDGSFLISGYSDFFSISSVARLLPDADGDGTADGVDETWIDGVGFSGAMVLSEGSGGFVPGVDGDAVLHLQDFDVFGGSRSIRPAPFAALAIDGLVADGQGFAIAVTGAPFADALLAISLDTVGPTLPGVGDLCVGFDGPHLVSPVVNLGASGVFDTRLRLDGVGNLVRLPAPLALQAFTVEGGEIGISNAIVEDIQP